MRLSTLLGTPEQTDFQGEAYHQTVLLLVIAEDMPRSPFFSQGCSAIPGSRSHSNLAPLLVLPHPWGCLAQEVLGKGIEPSRPTGNCLHNKRGLTLTTLSP